MRYACPCCEYFTLTRKPPGSYQICPVCYWEDDGMQFADPKNPGDGANGVCLEEARLNFKRIGASEPEALPYIRAPLEDEFPTRPK